MNAKLPLYKEVVALCGDQHRNLGITASTSLAFASQATAIPLGVSEFFAAARHFPIVFSLSGLVAPLVVTGLRANENLYVNANGAWPEDVYGPAWLRRYPFLLTGPDGAPALNGDTAVLAVDMACDRINVTDPNRQRLFDDAGEPAELTRNIAAFCQQGVEEEARTRAFVQDLFDAGLLVPASRQVHLPGGAVRTVEGFHTIEPQRFRELPDATVTRWFRSGWLDAASNQITSQQNWGALGDRLVGRLRQAAAAPAA